MVKDFEVVSMFENELTLRNCTFAFKCSAQWNSMEDVTLDGTVRFCLDCQKEVYYCQSDAELFSNIKLNRCVAIHSYYKKNEPLDDDPIMVGLPIEPSYT
jgi:hypothetical protein